MKKNLGEINAFIKNKEFKDFFTSQYKTSGIPIAIYNSNYKRELEVGWDSESEEFLNNKKWVRETFKTNEINLSGYYIINNGLKCFYKKDSFGKEEKIILYSFPNKIDKTNRQIFEPNNEEIEVLHKYIDSISLKLKTMYQKNEYVENLEEKGILYEKLFRNLQQGVAISKLVLDEDGRFLDFITLDCNEAYEKLIQRRKCDIIGKTATEMFKKVEKIWQNLDIDAVINKKEVTKKGYATALKKHLKITAYPYADMLI